MCIAYRLMAPATAITIKRETTLFIPAHMLAWFSRAGGQELPNSTHGTPSLINIPALNERLLFSALHAYPKKLNHG